MKFQSRFTLLFVLLFTLISCSQNKNYLPDNFFGLTLTRKLTGDDAKSFVDKLHFQNVATTSNEIGFYKGEKGEAIIYISYYESKEKAFEDEIRMTKKISPENSAFIMGSYIEINERKIYRTFGMGQTHYVFTHYNSLFWLSVETVGAEKFLEEYLNFLSKIK